MSTSVPPAFTVIVGVPESAPRLPLVPVKVSVPPLIVVAPWKVLIAVKVRPPDPTVNAPVPETTPVTVCAAVLL